MPTIKGWELDTLKPGSVILVGSKRYIKMEDHIPCHVEGCILDSATGRWMHWSQIAMHDSDVEIEEKLIGGRNAA